ncbi:MAG: ComEA family DNA-binding protein [Desulfobulbaceae bacterium]|nr:ComEA family DNA-binding protein [Desulfobulbaceae bacterium]
MNKIYFSLILILMLVSTAFAKVNINTADATELESLTGIGAAKAKAIIEYREQNGPFKFGEELTKVKGIGPKIMEKIKDDITISDDVEDNKKDQQ